MSEYVRVYHPSLPSWQDVPQSAADEWKAAGWLKTKPKHVDDSDALPPGEGYQPPTVVNISGDAGAHIVKPEPAAEPPAKGDGK